MKHRLILLGPLVFAMGGFLSVAHATSLADLCGETITKDTEVTIGGQISRDCEIEVANAKLEIKNVTFVVEGIDNGDDGELRIEDVTGLDIAEDDEDDGAAELIIKNSTIITAGKLRIEGNWDDGVTFKNNRVDTGDDLRIKPVGSGDLDFKDNRGQVVDDIRIGDVIKDNEDNIIGGLNGEVDLEDNDIILIEKMPDDSNEVDPTEFVVQSFDGDIEVEDNRLGSLERIDITSSNSGDVEVENNRFRNAVPSQEILIAAEDGDVSVKNNRFNRTVDPVEIESTTGDCESKSNRPKVIDQEACRSSFGEG